MDKEKGRRLRKQQKGKKRDEAQRGVAKEKGGGMTRLTIHRCWQICSLQTLC